MESKRDIERFIDEIKYGRMTRRKFKQAMASVGLATVMLPSGRIRGAKADEELTMFTWAGYEVPEMHQEYIAKYGSSPNFSNWGDEEEAEAKMVAGYKPDAAMPCSYKVVKWTDRGFLKPLDTDRLSHWGELIPSLQEVPDTVINGQRMWIPAWWGLTSVTFRHDLAPEYVGEENHTWGILWDEKYSGRLSMIDSLIDGVMVAAIYSGAKNPFDMTEEEVAKCRELMVRQKPLLRFYSNDSTGWQQALASGELIAADSWNDTILNLSNEGVPATFMHPKEGAMTWTCGLVLTSWVTPEKEERAYDLLNAYLSKETGVYWLNEFGMGHSNLAAFDELSAEELYRRGLETPDKIEAYIAGGIFQATIRNESVLSAMYDEVKAGA
jgi:spermidine/putrescine transport system substrate-binding protein